MSTVPVGTPAPEDDPVGGGQAGIGRHGRNAAKPQFLPPEPAALAGRLGDLEVLEILGQGGMGAVYRARQIGLDRIVAVKVLPPEVGSDPEFAERFTREARSLARLNHPNIVAVYDFGRSSFPDGPDLYYFVMEYVDGTCLRDMIRSGTLAPKEALAIVPQICEALQYAHEEGIIHRDIKPENILLDRRGRVKIADFGLAKLVGRREEERLTRDDVRVGTPQYMAPEQFERPREVDHRADIYSLGVVFYEMLTRELPLGRFPPPSARVEVDLRLDEVVLRSLEREPERRYQSAGEVRTRVETIRVSSPPNPTAPALPAAAAAGTGGAPIARDAALRDVRGPSTALLAAAILNWIGSIAVFTVGLWFVAGRPAEGAASAGGAAGLPPYLYWIAAAVFLSTGLMVYGALKMRHLEGRGAALLAGAVAAITSPGNLIGFPAGIWVWVTLHRPEVREAFAARRRHVGRRGPPPRNGRGGGAFATQRWAAALCLLGLATVAVPWAHTAFLGDQWTFGWSIPCGLTTAVIAAVLLVIAGVTSRFAPASLARSLLLALGGLALAAAGSWYIHEFSAAIDEELRQQAALEVPAAPEGREPAAREEARADSASGAVREPSSLEEMENSIERALGRAILTNSRPHAGPYLAIAAGMGLLVITLLEMAGRPRPAALGGRAASGSSSASPPPSI